jgi:thioredoxin-like negative regulator of GroEL
VRILAFSSDACRQCHTLQAPALRRLAAARPDEVAIRELDAPSHSALAERFRILTLPSTVLLDVAGRPLAINYGFANTEKLLAQVDSALAHASAPAR